MADLKISAVVDTREIERLCIGGRLYDAFEFVRADVKPVLDSIVQYDRQTKTVRIPEDKLLELYKLVNRHTKAEHIEIIEQQA